MARPAGVAASAAGTPSLARLATSTPRTIPGRLLVGNLSASSIRPMVFRYGLPRALPADEAVGGEGELTAEGSC